MDDHPETISLSVTWSGDENLAYISGTLSSPLTQEIVIESIEEVLSENGIVYGIKEDRIKSIASELIRTKSVTESLIATGNYPIPGKTSEAEFTVKTYLESEFGDGAILKKDRHVHCAQLLKFIDKPYIVKENEQVGSFSDFEDGEAGISVFGESVKASSCLMGFSEKLDRSFTIKTDTCKIVAAKTGIIIRSEEKTYILPIMEDGIAHIQISEDQLKVYVYLIPSGPNGKRTTKEDIKKLLDEKSVSFGIKQDAIENALEKVRTTGKKVDKEPVAEGKAAIPGKDAEIHYFVNLTFSPKPKVKFNGRADYFDIHTFEPVREKQHLAEIIPFTEGVDGIDVFGNTINAPPGKSVQLSLGKNIEILKDKFDILMASKTGHVYIKNDTLFVEEILTINSNVDFNTGNVDFKGDIIVKGDVISRFSIKAEGSVYISGTVEDARIRAGGSVIVKGGFVGRGDGRIKADNDVIVKYVLNQTIIAKNDIMIEGESLDANLFSGNQIVIEKRKAWLIGGSVVACKSVRAYDIGNELNNKTNISCGKYLFVQNMLKESENRIARLKREITGIKKKIKVFASKNLQDNTRGKFEEFLREQLHSLQADLKVKKAQFKNNEKYYKTVFYEDTGEVTVSGTIYPGVFLKIGHHNLKNHDVLKKCIFFIKDDAIECTSIS